MVWSHTDDDGESETRVEARLITALGGGGSDSDRGSSDKLREGDAVEARYRGREKYYPGKIDRDRRDGTYDISYDDGERETRVEERLIRKKRGSSRSRSRSRSPSRGRMRVGTRVEARYRGRSKKYPGKISRVHADGTFDVSYDDGESETRVEARLITALGGGGSDSDRGSSDKLREGDAVEARYRGREKYYPGKIDRDRRDGTYVRLRRRIYFSRHFMTPVRSQHRILPMTTGNARRGSRIGSSARSVGVAGAGADPGVVVRRAAACASVRGSRRGTGTDSASKLQLP